MFRGFSCMDLVTRARVCVCVCVCVFYTKWIAGVAYREGAKQSAYDEFRRRLNTLLNRTQG